MPKRRTRNRDDDGTLVYSSGPDGSRSFGPGGKVTEEAGGAAAADLAPGDQSVRVSTDSRAGHGKVVTIVRGLVLTAASLEKLASELKVACGSGGKVAGATIVIQGDHQTRLEGILARMGYRLAGK
jgi:translation initiation factor 1